MSEHNLAKLQQVRNTLIRVVTFTQQTRTDHIQPVISASVKLNQLASAMSSGTTGVFFGVIENRPSNFWRQDSA